MSGSFPKLLTHLIYMTIMLFCADTSASESQYTIIPLKIYYNNVIKYRLRSRNMKNINISSDGDRQVAAGYRDCTDEERSVVKCMSGECEALVTSSIHIFLHCKCPSDSRGLRCEEVKIDDSQMGNISTALSQIVASPLCHGVNILENKAIFYDFDIVKHCALNLTARDLRRFLRKNVLSSREQKLVKRQLAKLDKKKYRRRKQKKKSSRSTSQSKQLDMLNSALGSGLILLKRAGS